VTPNALRWDGRAGWYEVWYVVVTGRFWLRYTIHVPDDPDREGRAALWLASWTGAPAARRWEFPLEEFRTDAGGTNVEIAGARLDDGGAAGAPGGGAAWELAFAGGGRPFEHAHRLVRPLTRSRVVLAAPALEITGSVELDGERHELERAPGHRAHVFGSRHADRFAWAHAGAGGGRWLELLAAKLPGLPLLAAHASDRGAVNAPWRIPFVGAELAPERSRIGPYEVAARRDDFVGVTYEDPDGTPLFCYHTERARITGPGLEAADASYEFATRAPLDGWTIAL
jgi:hypothetical protein